MRMLICVAYSVIQNQVCVTVRRCSQALITLLCSHRGRVVFVSGCEWIFTSVWGVCLRLCRVSQTCAIQTLHAVQRLATLIWECQIWECQEVNPSVLNFTSANLVIILPFFRLILVLYEFGFGGIRKELWKISGVYLCQQRSCLVSLSGQVLCGKTCYRNSNLLLSRFPMELNVNKWLAVWYLWFCNTEVFTE